MPTASKSATEGAQWSAPDTGEVRRLKGFGGLASRRVDLSSLVSAAKAPLNECATPLPPAAAPGGEKKELLAKGSPIAPLDVPFSIRLM